LDRVSNAGHPYPKARLEMNTSSDGPAPTLHARAQRLLDAYRWEWNGERVVFPIGTPIDGELSRAAQALVRASPPAERSAA